jgi:hypothetical protein
MRNSILYNYKRLMIVNYSFMGQLHGSYWKSSIPQGKQGIYHGYPFQAFDLLVNTIV